VRSARPALVVGRVRASHRARVAHHLRRPLMALLALPERGACLRFGVTRRVVCGSVVGMYLNKLDVADLARKLRNAGMGDYADRIEAAYKDGNRLFHISNAKRVAFFIAVDR